MDLGFGEVAIAYSSVQDPFAFAGQWRETGFAGSDLSAYAQVVTL
jgi:hypothetical protein